MWRRVLCTRVSENRVVERSVGQECCRAVLQEVLGKRVVEKL